MLSHCIDVIFFIYVNLLLMWPICSLNMFKNCFALELCERFCSKMLLNYKSINVVEL